MEFTALPAELLTASKQQPPRRSTTDTEEECAEDRAKPLFGIVSVGVVLSEA